MFYIMLLVVGFVGYFLWSRSASKNNLQTIAPYISEESTYPLTARQITIIKQSWQAVLPIKSQAAELFYARLFELDPTTKALFKGKLDYQGDKLMTTLNVVVNAVDNVDDIVPMLEAMGKRHIIYGVEHRHYETVGVAFLWVLEQGLGDQFTDEVKEAWTLVYHLIANYMKEA